MARRRLTPSDKQLLAWREEGLTHQQMVQRHLDESGILVARSSISVAFVRMGQTCRKRYWDLLPWARIATQHNSAYPATMLRLEHRRMQSEHLRLNDLKRLQSWKEKLFERNLIVAYDYEKGFMYVTRHVQDGESLFRLDPPSDNESSLSTHSRIGSSRMPKDDDASSSNSADTSN
jgi:hypothetical protein